MSTTPVMFDQGDVRMVPQEDVADAIRNGGTVAQKILFEGNDARYVPLSDVHDAITKGGGQLMGTAPSAHKKPAAEKDKRGFMQTAAEGTPFEGVGDTAKREAQ